MRGSPDRPATSPQLTPTAGTPATWNWPLAVSSTTSSTDASSSSAACSRARSIRWAEADRIDEPAICTEREPPVVLPAATSSVSPWMTRIASMGTPKRSEASIFQVVSWP